MITACNGENMAVRMADGEDLVQRLNELDVDAAAILGGIGMAGSLRLGFWNGTAYEERSIDEPVELLSMQGNFGRAASGDRVVHCHVVVGQRDGRVVGGHLLAAKVVNTAEVIIRSLPGITLERRPEPSGLIGLYPRV